MSVLMISMLLAGCGGDIQLVAKPHVPEPLTYRMPVVVALHMTHEFSQYLHKEERYGSKWQIETGTGQTETLTRLIKAMFETVVVVNDVAANSDPRVRAIIEPAVDEYSFITPRDAGSPFYAVSIKYRINIYTPKGQLADSWSFTGYGSVPEAGFDRSESLKKATELAIRDAGAKLVAEFRDQPEIRNALESAASETPASNNDQTSPAPNEKKTQ